MATIKVKIPDEGCAGCIFRKYYSKETSYQVYDEYWYCSLFDNAKIKDNKKCTACEMLSEK